MRNFRTEGIIIKRNNYSEADRIITVFTIKHGKLKVLAKGVRKITSRRLAHVELLNHTEINVYQAKSKLILTEASLIHDYSSLKNDLYKIGLSYHICELIDGLCPEEVPYEKVFELLISTLNKLTSTEDIITLIHEFEVSLLSILGYWNRDVVKNVNYDMDKIIESIIERRLKSKRIFSKL